MYNIGKKRFVTIGNQRSERKEQTLNKREIRECRQEPKALNKLFRRATGNYCDSIDDRWYQIRAIKTTKSKATEAEEKEKREKLCKICQEPIQIYQGAPTKERSGTLHCSKEEVEEYLHETHSDPMKEEQL